MGKMWKQVGKVKESKYHFSSVSVVKRKKIEKKSKNVQHGQVCIIYSSRCMAVSCHPSYSQHFMLCKLRYK